MNIADAALRLKRLCAAEVEPILSDSTVNQLLQDARIADSDGNLPGSTDWVETYDLYRAVAEGWSYKAAQVAADYTFAIDGQSFSRAQTFAHFREREAFFRKRSRAGLGTIELDHWQGNPNVVVESI